MNTYVAPAERVDSATAIVLGQDESPKTNSWPADKSPGPAMPGLPQPA